MHIFISYSKKNKPYAQRLKTKLLSEGFDVWIDDRIYSGDDWWRTIVQAIRKASAFVVIMTDESDSSEWVQNEVTLAKKYQIPPFPLWLSGDFDNSDNWAIYVRTQYTDVRSGELPPDEFYDRIAAVAPRKPHLGEDVTPATSEPMPTDIELELAGDIVNPPPLDTATFATAPNVTSQRSTSYGRLAFIIGIIAIVIVILGLVILSTLNQPRSFATPTTNMALNPTDTSEPTLTPTRTLEIALIVQTLDSQATVEQATKNAQSTDVARATAYAVGTKSLLDQTATATLFTATITPNITASIEAYRTHQAATSTSNFFVGLTVTATLWIATPTSTYTPTEPLTPTRTFTPTSTFTLTPIPLGFPGNPVTKNTDWKPQYQTFDGIEMALVPPSCFMMGTNYGNPDERPANKQCFASPFWIDRYEVTNKQYGSEGSFKGDSRPRDSITWFEAYDFCIERGARLPTEPEWEYSARGPDNLVFPWGNDFVASNVVYLDNSNGQTADVGSRPAGNSWVGVSDLNGNVWEWMSTIYGIYEDNGTQFKSVFEYPYRSDDGREQNSKVGNVYVRVVRGGAWNDSAERAAFRYWNYPTAHWTNNGFRCVLSY